MLKSRTAKVLLQSTEGGKEGGRREGGREGKRQPALPTIN